MHGTDTWQGALVNRVSRYLTPTAGEREAMVPFHGNGRWLSPGETLIAPWSHNDSFFVVEQGWLAASRELAGGVRQIIQFQFPGDLVGVYTTP